MFSIRERQIPHDTTYIWNLKYDSNELSYETITDIEKRLLVVKREQDVGEGWFGSLGLNVHYYIESG